MQMRHIYTKYSTLPHHINCSTKRPHVGKTWGNSWGNVFERMRTPKCRRTFPCPNSFTTNPTRRPSSFSYQSLALVHWSRPPMRTPHHDARAHPHARVAAVLTSQSGNRRIVAVLSTTEQNRCSASQLPRHVC